MPIHLADMLDKQLDSMLEAGIIVPSQAYYASPLVLVRKPDSSIRIRGNYKQLNKISLFDPEPMMSADEIFDHLGGPNFIPNLIFAKDTIRCLWKRSLKITLL